MNILLDLDIRHGIRQKEFLVVFVSIRLAVNLRRDFSHAAILNMSKFNRLAVLSLAISGIGFLAIAGYFVYQKTRPRSPLQLYSQGYARMQSRDYPLAFQFIKAAADLEPNNTNFVWGAAVVANQAGRRSDALSYLRKAWQSGFRGRAPIELLLELLPGVSVERELQEVLSWVRQLPVPRDQALLESQALSKYGKNADAVRVLRTYLSQVKDPEIGTRLAQMLFNSAQIEEGRTLLMQLSKARSLDESGYSLLALSFSGSPSTYQNGLKVFEEARLAGIWTPRLQFENGILHLLNLRPNPAATLFAGLKGATTNVLESAIHLNARLFLAYHALSHQDVAAIQELKEIASRCAEGPEREGELLFLQGIELELKESPESLGFFEKASKLLPPHPVVALLLADDLIRSKRDQDALRALGVIRGPIQRWAPFILTQARAYMGSGQDAEASRCLDGFHAQGISTEQSVLLLRELAFRLNRPETGRIAQEMLEKQYPDSIEAKLFKGFLALGSGDTNAANRIIEDLVIKHPKDERAKIAKIQLLLGQERFTEAQAAIVDLKVVDAVAQSLRGTIFFRQGEFEKSAQSFELALHHSQPGSVHMEFAKVLGVLGRTKDATNQFSIAISKDPTLSDAWLGLALAAYAQGDLTHAREQSRSLFAISTSRTERNYLLVAGAEMSQHQLTNALVLCEQALSSNPGSLGARFARAQVLSELGRFDEAQKDLRRVIEADPSNLPVRQLLAQSLIRIRDFKSAAREVQSLTKSSPTNTVFRLLEFELLGMQRQFAEAGELLNKMQSTLEPARFVSSQAWLAEQRGATNEALRLLETSTQDRENALRWAKLKLRVGDFKNLLPTLQNQKLEAEDWSSLASLAEQAGSRETASVFYAEAMKLDSENPDLINNWAWNAMQQPGYNLGVLLPALKSAHEKKTSDLNILDTYVEALLVGKRFRESIGLLEQNGYALRNSPQLAFLLARSYEGLGDTKNAATYYRQAKEASARQGSWTIRTTKDDLDRRITAMTGLLK